MWNLFTWICDYDSRWHPFTPASDLFSMRSFAIFSSVGLAVVGVSVSLRIFLKIQTSILCITCIVLLLLFVSLWVLLLSLSLSIFWRKKMRTWLKSFFLSSGDEYSKYYIFTLFYYWLNIMMKFLSGHCLCYQSKGFHIYCCYYHLKLHIVWFLFHYLF